MQVALQMAGPHKNGTLFGTSGPLAERKEQGIMGMVPTYLLYYNKTLTPNP